MGECRSGTQTCTNGQWGQCEGEVLPSIEICDGKDNNCNGEIDEGLSTDADGDGHFTPESCQMPNDDCNDNDPEIYPGAPEICDGKDNNCNGEVDEDLSTDADGDGHYTPASCKTPNDDCDDNDPDTYPGANEICGNCKDNDCDEKRDEDCCKIENFTGTSALISAITGGPIRLTASITNTCDYPVNWSLIVPESGLSAFTGTGSNVSVTWNGIKSNEEVIGQGAYPANLSATTEVCEVQDTATINVSGLLCDTFSKNCCMREVHISSSADIMTGNLRHSQTLFTIPNSKILGDFTLSYSSLESSYGFLGKGWTHTYDIHLMEYGDIAVITEGDGRKGLLYRNGDYYVPKFKPYPRLVKNEDETYSLTHQDGSVYLLNQSGKISSITDRNGNTETFVYNRDGNLISVTDPSGRSVEISYYENNKISKVSDPMGNKHQMTFTGGVLTEVTTITTEGESESWSYTYDAGDYMLTKTDPEGYTVTYTYDDRHRILTSTDHEGGSKTMTYSTDTIGAIRITTLTEKDGGIWTYKYDNSTGQLIEKADPEGNATRYIYDAAGNNISTTGPDGATTIFTYDAEGNMSSSTDPAGNTTAYIYNVNGQILSITDPEGKITTYKYDERGNMTSFTGPSGETTIYQYDSRGNAVAITNAEGRTTSFTHDQYNFLRIVTDHTGTTTSFTYDSAGNMISQTDSYGNTTLFEYDSLNRLATVIDPSGKASSYTYDAKGNRTSSTDASGNTTYYEYDFKGRLMKVTDSLGNATSYTYGRAACPSCGGGTDKLTSITDVGGNTTSYEYDLLGRLVRETDPAGNSIIYTYDTSGNVISKTDATGITIIYTYDLLNRLTLINYPDPSQNVSYTYDTSGKVLSMTDQAGLSTYTYDDANRLIYETRNIDGIGHSLSYTYTPGGSLSSITYPSGRTIAYNQDSFGRIANVTEAKDSTGSEVISNIAYNANNTVSSITYGNSLVTTKGYDLKGALSSLNIGTLRSFTYTRDNVGNITSIIDNIDPAKTKNYAYDRLYRLTEATGPWGTIQFSYDPVGNRTKESSGAGNTNYTYDANKLISSSGVKPYIFGYDDNGNIVAESRALIAERSYIYNQNQRLIKAVEDNQPLGEYVYNGSGQRVKKTVDGKTTYYIYDQSGNLLEEVDGEGKPLIDYIYLGSTPIGRVDFQYDTVPPVTTAMTGEPKYETAETLYVSGTTTISLSSIDEGTTPSGVDYTEYRIDGDVLWKRYSGPFNLISYTEAPHTISYRSIDKAGNLEDAKTLAVTLDKTAPVNSVEVGSPQYQAGEKLYIGGSTPITIIASDSGSGVGKTEYAIDGVAYKLYSGPFSLSSYGDGEHIIRYRSVDNVNNRETDRTVAIVLDSMPPSTVIFASDELIEGGINTVSPKTRFFLNSTDSGTHIKEIRYRIDNGLWNTYLAGFPLPGIAGEHTIGYRAMDILGNEEPEQTFTVKMIIIDLTIEISLEPVVLAGAWGSTPEAQAAIENLTNILSVSGLSYYILQTEEEFKTSLRSGSHNTYLLVDFKTEGLADELKEAINYGDGIVYIKTQPNAVPSLGFDNLKLIRKRV